MKINSLWVILVLMVAGSLSSVSAFEIITEEDIRQGVVVNVDLMRTADNAIILFDSSSTMNKPFKDTGMSRYEIAKKAMLERNQYFPDLGYHFGLYLHTPWREVYPAQIYDRESFGRAIASLPDKARGPNHLNEGLKRLDSILKNLEGKTAVFIYTDGSYTNRGVGRKKPAEIARELTKKYNVCFYLISTADDYHSLDLFNKKFNFCSRVIAFDDFINQPLYNSEALFTVKSTQEIVTVTDKKVMGIKTRPFLFDTGKTDLSQDVKDRLKVLAAFLNENKQAYAVMAGHTDNMGSEDYNLEKSHGRVEAIAAYLVDNFKVDDTQLIRFWFGEMNPVADNSTPEGRKLNRRVDILVGGF